MKVDTKNIISVTEASSNVSKLITEAMDGRTWVIMKGGKPAAVIVGMEEMDRLQALQDSADDLRLWTMSLVRMITDGGERHDLDAVAEEFGVDLTEDDED